jgi:hypothetical protein
MSDADWVEDVKRWYLAGAEPARSADAAGESESAFIGYEAANRRCRRATGRRPAVHRLAPLKQGPPQAAFPGGTSLTTDR